MKTAALHFTEAVSRHEEDYQSDYPAQEPVKVSLQILLFLASSYQRLTGLGLAEMQEAQGILGDPYSITLAHSGRERATNEKICIEKDQFCRRAP